MIVADALLVAQTLLAALDRQPASDYRMRRETLAARLDGGVALLFAPNESEGPNDLYGYRPDDNFYYLTGWSEPGAAVLIAVAVDGKDKSPARPYTEILFLPSRNPSQEKWTGPSWDRKIPKLPRLPGFDRVEVLDHLRDVLTGILSAGKATVYTDLPAYEQISNSESALDWLKRANSFPVRISFEDVRPLLSSLRTFKDAGEIELIRKAANASIAAHFAAFAISKARSDGTRSFRPHAIRMGQARLRASSLCSHRGLGIQLHRAALFRRFRNHASGRRRGH